jgi:hypothetical protein
MLARGIVFGLLASFLAFDIGLNDSALIRHVPIWAGSAWQYVTEGLISKPEEIPAIPRPKWPR